jgi:hypothetical protein
MDPISERTPFSLIGTAPSPLAHIGRVQSAFVWSRRLQRYAGEIVLYFLSRLGFGPCKPAARGGFNAGTTPPGKVTLNPYKEAICLHRGVIENPLVPYGIGAT